MENATETVSKPGSTPESVDLSIIRLLISFASMLDFEIALADVKGPYRPSGSIMQELHVILSKKIAKRATMLTLRHLPKEL